MLDPAEKYPTGVPWYIWACVIAVTSGGVGGIWDISWHKSIGRDTFWTPAHVLIYLCGVIAGLTCGYVILATTFGRNQTGRAASVAVWGFRGPLGAFLCAWGGIAMITSAPFDDWWHNAYGLDVRVLSPPHVVLMFGLIAIRVGTLLFILGELNRAQGRSKAVLNGLLLYTFMTIMAISLGAFQEITIRSNMHSARFYLVVSLAIPLWLATVSAVSSHRWACTTVAALYTAYYVTFIWILPLFPAEPKLGPCSSGRNPICPAGLSAAADRARLRHRSAEAQRRRLAEMAARRGCWLCLLGGLLGSPVALREVASIAGGAQLDLRSAAYSFLRAAEHRLCALRFHAARAKRVRVLAHHGARALRSRHHDQDRARLGYGDEQTSAVGKRARSDRMSKIGFPEMIRQDMLYGLKTLGRNPVFALTAVLTLSIGVGANTAIFTMVHAVLLKPLDYRDPDPADARVWRFNTDEV